MAEIRRVYRISDGTPEEINMVLAQLSDRLDQMEGYRGTPAFHADIDVKNNRLLNVSSAVEATDGINLGQLQSYLLDIYPVGSLRLETANVDPGTYIGGTWALWGQGRFIVGYKSGDADFGAVGGTGGTKTKDLTHTHEYNTAVAGRMTANDIDRPIDNGVLFANDELVKDGSAGSSAQDILPPFIVAYIWQRTA